MGDMRRPSNASAPGASRRWLLGPNGLGLLNMLCCEVFTEPEPNCIEETSELVRTVEVSNPLPGELLLCTPPSAPGRTERSTTPSMSFRFVSSVYRFSWGGGGGGVT